MLEKILVDMKIYVFAKDKNLKYLFCNENLAEIAGLDSPHQIIRKTDFDLCWKRHAEFYRLGDRIVLAGGSRINAQEVQTRSTGIANILISKKQFVDSQGRSIGVIGSYIDIAGYYLEKRIGNFDLDKKRFYLGEIFGNEYFTKREVDVFKYILYGYTAKRIAAALKLSRKTVESYIEIIKRKLQCNSKNEIAATAIQHGLTYILDDNLWKV